LHLFYRSFVTYPIKAGAAFIWCISSFAGIDEPIKRGGSEIADGLLADGRFDAVHPAIDLDKHI
jgi:hypothetical protein